MLEKLRDLWMHGKDRGASYLAKHQINKQLEPYGTMLRLQIDSTKKAVQLELMLKGETHPIIVSIDEYVIQEDASGLNLLVKKISTSREWITVVGEKFLVGRKIPISKEYATF